MTGTTRADPARGTAAGLLLRYPGRSLAVTACLFVSGLSEGVGVGAILPLLNLVIRRSPDGAGPVSRAASGVLAALWIKSEVLPLLLLILAAFLVKAAVQYAAMRVAVRTAAGMVVEVRKSFLRALLDARWDFFQAQPAGRLGTAISNEAEQTADLYLTACRMLAHSIQIAVYLALAFAISWRLSLWAVGLGAIGYAVLNGLISRTRHASTRFYEGMRSLLNGLVDSLQGLKPLKAMGLERRTEPYLAGQIGVLRSYKVKTEMNRVTLDILREPLQLVTAGLGFAVGFYVLKIGFVEMALTLLIFTRILDGTTRFQSLRQNYVRLEPAYCQVKHLMGEAQSAKERLGQGVRPELRRAIRLEGVSFRRGRRTILQDVTLAIAAGRITMLRGPSGAGKTTVADLVVGLISPNSGRILVDGRPLDMIDLKAWRSLIGYVPQELFLFHDTVMNNVTLGDPAFGPAEAEAALRAANAWDFVQAMPEGLRSVVGERGSKLSGGQRQRIAIARVLLRRPRLLILDEATSGLDPRAEMVLVRGLKRMPRPPAVLVISHRSSFRRAADAVYTFQGSRVKRVRPPMRTGRRGAA